MHSISEFDYYYSLVSEVIEELEINKDQEDYCQIGLMAIMGLKNSRSNESFVKRRIKYALIKAKQKEEEMLLLNDKLINKVKDDPGIKSFKADLKKSDEILVHLRYERKMYLKDIAKITNLSYYELKKRYEQIFKNK